MSGYSDASGSLCSQQMAGFFSRSKDVYNDNKCRPVLTSRARILNITSTIARSIHDCLTRGVIGSGVRYEPNEKSVYYDDVVYREISKDLKNRINKLSNTKLLDANKQLTFTELEELVFLTMIVSGECWLFRSADGLSWKIKEPDYIKTPDYLNNNDNSYSVKYNNNLIIDGIEVDTQGLPVACWFCENPFDDELKNNINNYCRIPFYDEKGLPCVLQVFIKERPDQLRGLPLTAPVLVQLWSTLAYSESELQMAILQVNQSLVITTNTNPTLNPFGSIIQRDLDAPLIPTQPPQPNVSEPSKDFSIFPPMGNNILDGFINKMNFVSPGQSHHLAEGEDIKFLTPTAPNTNLSSFLDLMLRQIGAALGIPEQVLSGRFDANFSAVKGACSAFNHTIKRYRTRFIESFLKPLFENLVYNYLQEEVENISQEQCLENAELLTIESVWLPNDSPLTLDPTKEIDFYIKAIEAGLITRDEAATLLFGHKANGNINNNDL